MSEDRGVIVGGDHDMIPGSKPFRCTSCGTGIFLTPSGRELMRREQLVPVCTPCGLKELAEDPAPQVMPLHPTQASELLGMLRRN